MSCERIEPVEVFVYLEHNDISRNWYGGRHGAGETADRLS